MAARRRLPGKQRQVLFFLVFSGLSLAGAAKPRLYSVVEETEGSSTVTNLAKDLSLGQGELSRRAVRVVSKGNRLRLQLDPETGDLLLTEKLDREEICGPAEPCVLRFQVLLENPLEFFQAEIQVIDINDHSPVFPDKEMLLKISESSPPGTTFPLQNAQDVDVGPNDVDSYIISPNSYFRVLTRKRSDGKKYPELVLDQALDREEEPELRLTLTAQDGGSPPRSGSAQVRIEVVDVNDNAPEFGQPLYRVQVPEDSPTGFLLLRVSATDADTGLHAQTSYSLFQASDEISKTFELNARTGEIRLKKQLDFENIQSYEVTIEARDAGSLSGKCTVLIQVLDVNDHVPEVTISALTNPIPENAPETVVAVFSVSDLDSEENGKISCSIPDDLPFALKSSVENFYTLVTDGALDREARAEYNITITMSDLGTPRLTTRHHVAVQVSDVNDNAPAFSQAAYTLLVRENNSPGLLIGSVSASDRDAGANAQVTYSLLPPPQQPDVAALVSVHADSGQLYALRALDYEALRAFEFGVRAADRGSPALSSEARVRVQLLDLRSSGSKVRIVLSLNKLDAPKQRLLVLVRDHGELPPVGYQSKCTTVLALVAARLCGAGAGGGGGGVGVGAGCAVGGGGGGGAGAEGRFPGPLLDVSGGGTLSHSYQYEVRLTGDAGAGEFKFMKPILPNFQGHSPESAMEPNSNFRNDFDFSMQLN
nr:protocadherin beta-8 [Oryctolagus cuniculus]